MCARRGQKSVLHATQAAGGGALHPYMRVHAHWELSHDFRSSKCGHDPTRLHSESDTLLATFRGTVQLQSEVPYQACSPPRSYFVETSKHSLRDLHALPHEPRAELPEVQIRRQLRH